MTRAVCRARANIALAKYWGKSDVALNLPAVPSVSITLDPLITETTVELDDALDTDTFELDGAPAREGEMRRVAQMLDGLRKRANRTAFARVTSVNEFPTAAGLASSASGFAALAGAASAAMGLALSETELSAIARQASASAARSVYGGFVSLDVGQPGDAALAATPVAGPEHWDLRVIVAVTASGRKKVGSRAAMEESRRSSFYYDAWVERTPASCEAIIEAILERDFERLAPLAEQSFLAMHAVAMTSIPAVHYWQPASVAAMRTVRALRDGGTPVFATMDAGPHVKAICPASAANTVRDELAATPGVIDTIVASPGPGLEVSGP